MDGIRSVFSVNVKPFKYSGPVLVDRNCLVLHYVIVSRLSLELIDVAGNR